MKRLRYLIITLCFAGPLAAVADLEGYSRHDFSLPPETERLLVLDANSNGLSDLLVVSGRELLLFLQSPLRGFDFSQEDSRISLPGYSAGWDISRNFPGPDGEPALTVLALIDGTHVLAWPVVDGAFDEPVTVLDDAGGFPGPGVHQLAFARDINGNGREDLVIPGAGELLLYLRRTDGSYQQAIRILSEMRVRTTLNDDRNINNNVGQTVNIPMLQLRDVNGDGRPDLISDTSERLDVFLASSRNGEDYFPNEPSFSIDRLAIRERLGTFDVDQIDFSNLTGILALTHEEILQDVNGNGIDDVILREGGRVALYLGSEDGVDFSTPRQILRSGGNVLTTFLHDENENGRPDLWLWRVEQVSLADLFVWLAISGSINIEAFVYHNEGDSFARRPARRINVTLRFPSAVRMISSVRDIRSRARDMDAVIPAVRANISGNELEDLLVLLEEQVEIFYNALSREPEADEDRFLASLDYRRDRNNYEVDVRRIIDEFEIDINRDIRQMRGRSPDVSLTLPGAQQRGDILAMDLNNNSRDDILVFLERSNEAVTGMVLLSEETGP